MRGGICQPVAPPLPSNVSCTSAHILRGNACINPAQRAGLASAADSLNEWSNDLGFSEQPALEVIKAHYAYGVNGAGFDGTGVTIAFVGEGVFAPPVLQDANGVSRATRIHQIAFEPDPNYLDASVLVGANTIAANAAVEVDCGYSNSTCADTRYAGIAAGRTLSSTARNSSQMGVAPGAKLLDIPVDDFWHTYCIDRLKLGRFRCRTEGTPPFLSVREYQEVFASVLGAAMGAALAHGDKPRYVHVGHIAPTSIAPLFPIYGEGESPSGANLVYYQRLLEALGTPVWQGGAPASGEDTRSVFVMSAGNFAREIYSGVCANWNTGADAKSCGEEGSLSGDPLLFGMLPRIAQLVGSTGVPMGSDLAATFLVVVPLDSTADGNGQYPGYIRTTGAGSPAQRCGRAAAWCIAAPGEGLKTYDGGGSYTTDFSFDGDYPALVVGAPGPGGQRLQRPGEHGLARGRPQAAAGHRRQDRHLRRFLPLRPWAAGY